MYTATGVYNPDNPGIQYETLQGETVLCSVLDISYMLNFRLLESRMPIFFTDRFYWECETSNNKETPPRRNKISIRNSL